MLRVGVLDCLVQQILPRVDVLVQLGYFKSKLTAVNLGHMQQLESFKREIEAPRQINNRAAQ